MPRWTNEQSSIIKLHEYYYSKVFKQKNNYVPIFWFYLIINYDYYNCFSIDLNSIILRLKL